MFDTILILLLALFGAMSSDSSLASAASACQIQKMPGIESQGMENWQVSILKESKRKQEGDAFLGVDSSGKRCELELKSWGEALYLAKAAKPLVLVEQSDTDYTELTWIDPAACKILKNIREVGRLTIGDARLIFSGGQDGPDKIPSVKISLNPECLPIGK